MLNERSNLDELLGRLRAQALPDYELVVVDDGSTDGTRERLRELAAADARLRLLFHDGRQTTVGAQAQGIATARGRWVVIMDADLQHPPEALPAVAAALEGGASLVVASRYAPGGSPGPRPWVRALISRAAERYARLRLAETRGTTDPMSGFFGFERATYRPLPAGTRGFKLLLFVLVMHGRRPVAEVGFRFARRPGGTSKLTEGWGFIPTFLREVRLVRRLRPSLEAPTPVPPAPRPSDP